MNRSQYAVLRITAMMVGADGNLHPKQVAWFQHILKRYNATPEQIATFNEDAKGPRDVEGIYLSISNPLDREKLQSWLKIVMTADGIVHPAERELFERVQNCHRNASEENDPTFRAVARATVESLNERDFWEKIQSLGASFSKRLPYPRMGWRFWW